METYDYRCICCGRRLDQERDLLYDISWIVFEGVLKEESETVDGSKGSRSEEIIPIYVPKNEFIKDILPEASAGNGKIGRLSLSKALSYLYSEKNAAAWKKLGITELPANLLELAGTELSKSIQEALREDDEENAKRTPEQKKAIKQFIEKWGAYLKVFDNNFRIEEGGERYCEFKIFELDDRCGYNFRLNKPQADKVYPDNAVRCTHCSSFIPSDAFTLPQRLIGYVGEQSAGKTCMMVATLNYLMKQHEQDCRLQIYDEGKYQAVIRDLALYNKGYIVPKTSARGGDNRGYNISVAYGKGTDRCILTFVDVPGEIFKQRFDMSTAENEYPAILHCDFYIVFARNIANSTSDLLTIASRMDDFIKQIAIKRNGFIPPFMCAISQIDKAEEIRVGGLDNNYDNNYSWYLPEIEKVPESSAYKFYNALSTKTFVTPMACSAYGQTPYDFRTGEKKLDGNDLAQNLAQQTDNEKPNGAVLFDPASGEGKLDVNGAAQTVETKPDSETTNGSRENNSSGRRVKQEIDPEIDPNKLASFFSPEPKNLDKIIDWIIKMYDTGLYKIKYEVQKLDIDQIDNIVGTFTNVHGFNDFFIKRFDASDTEKKIKELYEEYDLIEKTPKKKCLWKILFGKE